MRFHAIRIFTATREGIPGVLLEASARSLPTVSTDVGGVGEVISTGHSGVLVPPSSMKQLGKETVRLLNDPSVRSSLGNVARMRVEDSYDMESSMDDLESRYESYLKRKRPNNC